MDLTLRVTKRRGELRYMFVAGSTHPALLPGEEAVFAVSKEWQGCSQI